MAPSGEPLSRRWLFGASVVALLLTFLQTPGRLAADTKYDLSQNPIGFLERAAHQWSSQAPMGQVQNQAYGYFFPHGAFFALGDISSVPAWITQRVWWALLLVAGFWGIIRVAEALGIGSRSSRLIAAVAFAFSPRVLTTLGSISSETLPMMLAPWVLLPLVVALGRVSGTGHAIGTVRGDALLRSPARLAAQSALAVALMGAVNAVATAAACLVAGLWWISHRPNRRWWTFTAWWFPFLALATTWWIVPLLLLGKVSPPFLDYIESSSVTTQWTTLAEILRGTDSWTAFVSPERIAGAVLVTQPAAVAATGLIAAAGLAGLCMRSMPARGRLALILFVGIAGLAAGYLGELGSPFAEQVRLFLDSGGAPLRNVHKLEPLVRLPLVLGLAHLLAKVPLPGSVPFARWRSAVAHPEREPMVAVTSLILVALTLATSLAWTGKLAPRGTYTAVPGYWHQAAAWLADNAGGTSPDGSDAERALVVPGAPFGSQVWGLTRDEPLQALASTPWASRDAVPLTPPGTIRAMDSIQRLIADGRPSDGMAQTLLGQGIHYLVLRNDLDPDTSRSARPILVHQAVTRSPGFTQVAEFGEDIGPSDVDGLVIDNDLRPRYPAIEIFEVSMPDGAPTTSGPYVADLDGIPRVQGGPESLQRLRENGALPGAGPVLLAADARRAGLPVDDITVTDTPRDRETDYGQVDNHSSALRSPDDARHTFNLVPDYAVADTPLVEGQWEGARLSVSSAASDATQLGGTSPASSAAATVDGDSATGWFSNVIERALGQWIQIDFDTPLTSSLLHITTSPAAIGAPVRWMEVSTPNGTTAVKVDAPGEPITVSVPGGATPWVRITATRTENGSAGTQFGISELSVEDFSDPDGPVTVPIRYHTALPPTPVGTSVSRWDLSQELPGRNACAESPDRVRCSNAHILPPEEVGVFERTLSVPETTAVTPQLTVRARQGAALEELLTQRGRPSAHGTSDIGDLRGSAFAATDGDPRTSWSAALDTTNGKGAKPTLVIDLPEPTLVTGLQLTPSLGPVPAAPNRVAVDLGSGPQVRDVDEDDGTVALEPLVTDRIVLSLVSWKNILDQNVLGFAQSQPAGLADVGVLGRGGALLPGSGPTDDPGARTVTVPCTEGPVVTIGGQAVRTSITAPVGQILSGAPVPATVCDPAGPVTLGAGSQDVTVDPGSAFFVDSLRLNAGAPATPIPTEQVATTAWTENHRELTMPRSDSERLVVVPESTNVGWAATAPDGTELTPVVVDGWQQGWVVPAGTEGTVTLDFPTDRWYRLGIFGGLLLLIPLIAVAVWPRHSRNRGRDLGSAPRTWGSASVGWLGILAAATVIGGPVGAATTIVMTALVAALVRLRGTIATARILVGIAGASAMLGMAILSTGPWRAPGGYVGHSFFVQFPLLVALVATGLAVLPLGRSALLRRISQRLTARRAGSSTSA
ncbi:alpha-(1-_3)-arabinofuranosyltransferase [Rhodococcus marinonascens]|uniref:alpha-(1->3)-arabinofuranosyltransferase n=1 Tax=Rhodococcus marinonascens TaxID=38311 RepID=UPI000933D1DC|nr:alpha-(1->3)-arabinofuranosyltransferase [Rhodococcus marinonascens]